MTIDLTETNPGDSLHLMIYRNAEPLGWVIQDNGVLDTYCSKECAK